MTGYVRMDKDLEDDPRVLRLAGLLAQHFRQVFDVPKTDVTDALLVETGRNALLGALLTLWRYADTHVRRDNVLSIALRELAAITRLPVTVLEQFPPEWLRIGTDGNVELPDYLEKNSLDDKEKRKLKNRERQRRWRERHSAERNALPDVISNGRNAPSRGRAHARVPLPNPSPNGKTPPPPDGGVVSLRSGRPGRDVRNASRGTWDNSVGSVRRSAYAEIKERDPLAHQAILEIGGYRVIGMAQEHELPAIKERFRAVYERLLTEQIKREDSPA